MIDSSVRGAFPSAAGYLDTASYGLPSHATAQALHDAADAWAAATVDPRLLDPVVDRMRAAYARIVGADAADVTLAGSVSQVVGMVAASLPAGARVLVAEGDFASVRWPFAADPRLSVEVVPLERLVDAVREGVDLVAVSAAQSRDGAVIDLAALAQAARSAHVRTLVDVSQSAPWLPIDARLFDVVVAGAYKWLDAPRGIALAAVRPEACWVRPVYASWYGADSPWDSLYGAGVDLSSGARRLDASPPWPLLEAGATALELHARIGWRDAFAHTTGLADEFRAALGMAPAGTAIVSVRADARAFAEAGLRVAERGGRVRLGFHVYNDESDLARAVDAARAAMLVAA